MCSIKWCFLILVFFASCVATLGAEVTESMFFTDTIDSVDQTVSILDYGADGSDTVDDSAALQAAIDDMTALPNGGKITISAGTFYLSQIYPKSNVHLEIDPGATLVETDASGSMFSFGLDSSGTDALVTISNVSIRASSGRYTVDLSHGAPNPNKLQFVKLLNARNFMVADFYVLDNYTKMSSVTLNSADYNDQWFQPCEGVIINGYAVDSHYGYGLIQAQACNDVLFQDLSAVGGITLRLETGAVDYDAPDEIMLDEIYGRNISITNGHGAAMMGPHYRVNGHVDIDGVTAVGSLYAVSAGDGFVNKDEAAVGYTAGYFADTCVIKNVHAVYGEDAGYKSKNFDDIPCELRSKITPAPAYSAKIYRGPSSISVNDNTTNVTFSSVTQEGFVYRTSPIMSSDDEISSCSYVSVTGITLSDSRLTMSVAKTGALIESVTPAGATDPDVVWVSDNPSVVVVGVNGMIMAVDEGTATITATTLDGNFSASCSVTVSGGGGGQWSTLLDDDFESGWGNWANGWDNWGEDESLAALTDVNVLGAQGVFLLGETNRSVMHINDSMDLSAYSNLQIEFSYLCEDFVTGEDFWVQFSGNNGVTWQMVCDCVSDRDFQSDVRTNAVFIIDSERYNFSSESKLRIGCDKDGGVGVYIDDVVVSVFEQSGWGKYVAEHELSGEADQDADGDGQSDLIEYALGGDPADDEVIGTSPTLTYHSDDSVSFYFPTVDLTESGISYVAAWTDDLVNGSWSNVWTAESTESSALSGYIQAERQLDGADASQLFMRLRIEQP